MGIGVGGRGRLFFTIAPARAGKSTFANKWVVSEGDNPRVIVCRDDIRQALGHRWNSHVEHIVKATAHTMTETLLSRGFDVLVDETNCKWSAVEEILRIDPDAEPIWISYSHNECNERAIKTNQSDLILVISWMVESLEAMKEEWEAKIAQKREQARKFRQARSIRD